MPQIFDLVLAAIFTAALIGLFPRAWRQDKSPVWLKSLWLTGFLLFAAYFFLEAFEEPGHESEVSSVIELLTICVLLAAAVATALRRRATKQKP